MKKLTKTILVTSLALAAAGCWFAVGGCATKVTASEFIELTRKDQHRTLCWTRYVGTENGRDYFRHSSGHPFDCFNQNRLYAVDTIGVEQCGEWGFERDSDDVDKWRYLFVPKPNVAWRFPVTDNRTKWLHVYCTESDYSSGKLEGNDDGDEDHNNPKSGDTVSNVIQEAIYIVIDPNKSREIQLQPYNHDKTERN